jgi:hypothetical protein
VLFKLADALSCSVADLRKVKQLIAAREGGEHWSI